jgi:hypothetical protein
MRRRTPLLLAALVALALGASPSLAGPDRPRFTTTHLPGTAKSAEPRVTVAPDGTRWAVTSGPGSTEWVFRSKDGIHWAKVPTPPGQTSPTIDVDVAALPSGRIITSELDFAGINFINTYTDDRGETWQSSVGATFADTDRQWFAVGPNNTVYLLWHNLLSGTLQHQMWVQTSTDGGATFLPPVPVTHPGMESYLDLQCADSGGPSGISVNQKTGQVYVFFGTRHSVAGGCAAQPPEVNIVAATRAWVVTAPAADTTNPLAWKESLAVDRSGTGQIVGMQMQGGTLDDAGNVYVAYPESPRAYPDYNGAAIKLVHAPADLSSWSKPITVVAGGGAGHILPLVVAGDAGKVAVTYYTGLPDKTWRSDVAFILDALSAKPRKVTHTRFSQVEVEKGTASELMGACLSGATAVASGFTCDRSTDVNGIAMDKCGRVIAVWPSQTGEAPGTYVSQQTGGPRLRSRRG